MNDRLKFRAWDKVTNRWYDPKRIHIDGNGHVHWEPLYDKPMILEPDSVDVQWSTGLRDKTRTKEHPNGKLIFEGDITELKIGKRIWRHVVTVKDSCGSNLFHKMIWRNFENNEDGECVFGSFKIAECDCWSPYISKVVEIIGTLHENPELLESPNGQT